MRSGKTCCRISVSDEQKGSCWEGSRTSATGDSIVPIASKASVDEEIAEGNSANDDNPFSSGIIMIKLVHTNRRLMK